MSSTMSGGDLRVYFFLVWYESLVFLFKIVFMLWSGKYLQNIGELRSSPSQVSRKTIGGFGNVQIKFDASCFDCWVWDAVFLCVLHVTWPCVLVPHVINRRSVLLIHTIQSCTLPSHTGGLQPTTDYDGDVNGGRESGGGSSTWSHLSEPK